MTFLSVNGLSVSFGSDVLFSDLSFAIEKGDRLGVVGANGCGKTTLLKIITGEAEADSGEIYLPKSASVGILRQDSAFDDADSDDGTALGRMYGAFPELLAAEKRIEELHGWLERHADESDTPKHASITAELCSLNDFYTANGGDSFRARCRSVLAKMGFTDEEMSLPLGSLSGGQRTRLALSRRLCTEPDLLILDEPTNHLDAETLGWLENWLCGCKSTVIAVSHDRYFLDRVTNKTLFIDHKKGNLYKGGFSASSAAREEDRAIYERQYRNQEREIARQMRYIEQQRRWNRERNIIAAESRLKLLDKMEKLPPPEKDDERIPPMRFQSSIQSGSEVFTARGVSFSYGKKPIIENASFIIKRGERVFITGPNGCGKSTLISLLLGRLLPKEGKIEPGHNVNIGYYDQENQNLDPSSTVIDEIWNRYPDMPQTAVRSALAGFLFRGDDVFKEVPVLSGGERARLTLVRLMLSKMNTLLLDEPTNHLDILSREALEKAISAFDGTLVCVSHDRTFINNLATRILWFTGDGRICDMPFVHPGRAYDEWREAVKSSPGGQAAEKTEGSGTGRDEYLSRKAEQSQKRKAEARIASLKREQDELERKIEEYNAELYGPAANDYKRAAELSDLISQSETRLLEIYEELV